MVERVGRPHGARPTPGPSEAAGSGDYIENIIRLIYGTHINQ